MSSRNLHICFLITLLLALSGCYEMTVRITELPDNTPPSDNIYIVGNFNNWDPGDPKYIMQLNRDSVYEVRLPKGVGRVEYKFTRGDWSTVEKDACGYEITNRFAFYGRQEIVDNVIESWYDMPKEKCPKAIFIIDSLPQTTPENSFLYLAGNFNGWDPGNRGWRFSKSPEGIYYIEVPRPEADVLEYKVTRGDWSKVETRGDGEEIDNRVFRGKAGDVVYIKIEGWMDRVP